MKKSFRKRIKTWQKRKTFYIRYGLTLFDADIILLQHPIICSWYPSPTVDEWAVAFCYSEGTPSKHLYTVPKNSVKDSCTRHNIALLWLLNCCALYAPTKVQTGMAYEYLRTSSPIDRVTVTYISAYHYLRQLFFSATRWDKLWEMYLIVAPA